MLKIQKRDTEASFLSLNLSAKPKILIDHGLLIGQAVAPCALTACITACIKYFINKIFNNNLRYNIIVLVWHSNLTKEN